MKRATIVRRLALLLLLVLPILGALGDTAPATGPADDTDGHGDFWAGDPQPSGYVGFAPVTGNKGVLPQNGCFPHELASRKTGGAEGYEGAPAQLGSRGFDDPARTAPATQDGSPSQAAMSGQGAPQSGAASGHGGGGASGGGGGNRGTLSVPTIPFAPIASSPTWPEPPDAAEPYNWPSKYFDRGEDDEEKKPSSLPPPPVFPLTLPFDLSGRLVGQSAASDRPRPELARAFTGPPRASVPPALLAARGAGTSSSAEARVEFPQTAGSGGPLLGTGGDPRGQSRPLPDFGRPLTEAERARRIRSAAPSYGAPSAGAASGFAPVTGTADGATLIRTAKSLPSPKRGIVTGSAAGRLPGFSWISDMLAGDDDESAPSDDRGPGRKLGLGVRAERAAGKIVTALAPGTRGLARGIASGLGAALLSVIASGVARRRRQLASAKES